MATKWTYCKPLCPGGEAANAGEEEGMQDLQLPVTKEVLDPGSSMQAQKDARNAVLGWEQNDVFSALVQGDECPTAVNGEKF